MKKSFIFKKSIILFLFMAFLLSLALVRTNAFVYAKAEEVTEEGETLPVDELPANEAKPLSLYAEVSVKIGKDDTYVYSIVKNEFTLLPGILRVYAELYSFDRYQTTYSEDDLEAREYIGDLDMGKTLTASAAKNGRKRYWMAVTRYKLDDGTWQSMQTDAHYIE